MTEGAIITLEDTDRAMIVHGRDIGINPAVNHTNSGEEEDDPVSEISEVDADLLGSMEEKMSEQPKLLRASAGHQRSCCVFRVPRSFIDSNGNAYQPNIVSVGPYHHSKSHDLDLQKFQEHKWRYLNSLVSRTESAEGVHLEDYLKAIQSQEPKARDCYSQTIELTKNEFVEMMVLDGCFVIELFRKAGNLVPIEADDPIFAMSWVCPSLSRDLLRLENQIPFFILQCLFDLSEIRKEKTSPSLDTLATLALKFFNNSSLRRSHDVLAKYKNLKPKHLLDLLRSSFAPSSLEKPPENSKASTKMIHSVAKLRRAGITCNTPAIKSDSFLDIKFSHGEMKIPKITIDDFTCSFLQNCIAYEQCHRTCSKHVTTYAMFMDCHINTPEDVGLLCDGEVIQNCLGDDAGVAELFNKLGKDVAVNTNECYLSNVSNDVNEYYKINWHVNWATFRHKYFDSPWSFISLVADVLLLLLTISQTFFAAYDYYQPK